MDNSLTQTKKKETEQIYAKKERVLKFFESKGLQPDSEVTEDVWFLTSEVMSQKPEHQLAKLTYYNKYNFMINKPQEEGENLGLTVDQFVDEYLKQVALVHFDILDRQLNIDYLKDGKEQLEKAKKSVKSLDLENQENAIMLSYCKKTTYVTDIFKYYSIKYRIATVHQNFQSLFAEDSNRVCTMALDPLDKVLFFSVLGKRLDKRPDEEYKEIARIELPLLELCQYLRPRHLGLEIIPESYFVLSYKDQSVNAPFQDENQIEIRFDLRLDAQRRLDIIEQLSQENQKIIEELDSTIGEYLEQMKQLISIFGTDPKTAPKDLQYVRARGLGEEKDFPPIEKKKDDPDKPKDRDACCLIQ